MPTNRSILLLGMQICQMWNPSVCVCVYTSECMGICFKTKMQIKSRWIIQITEYRFTHTQSLIKTVTIKKHTLLMKNRSQLCVFFLSLVRVFSHFFCFLADDEADEQWPHQIITASCEAVLWNDLRIKLIWIVEEKKRKRKKPFKSKISSYFFYRLFQVLAIFESSSHSNNIYL